MHVAPELAVWKVESRCQVQISAKAVRFAFVQIPPVYNMTPLLPSSLKL